MAKTKTEWICSECGDRFPRSLGRCTSCGTWGSLVEQVLASPAAKSPQAQLSSRTRKKRLQATGQPLAAITLPQIEQSQLARIPSGYGEFDRVLGGGIVPGSLVLIGGDPGVGKSTLLLQSASYLSQNGRVLYVCAEESGQQIKLRASRLNIDGSKLYILPETDLDAILLELETLQPQVAIVDSIQAIFWAELSSAPGSVSQVRECTSALMRIAKQRNIALAIVGHVTKDGAIAGPKVLEHLVDTVLYFEGDRFQTHRLLRSVKNRFGATQEVGVFDMASGGLQEVTNPSELFISGRDEIAPGTATIVACEGTRPLVVEVQALVSPTSYSSPRRTTTGIETSRFLQILAVLEKRVGIPLSKLDAYIASAGGINVAEPAADLGVAVAIAASFRDRIVDPYTVLMGEVGLGGQVRPISQLEQRLKEASKLGFRHAIIPKGQVLQTHGLRVTQVSRVLEALVAALPGVDEGDD
ncbi:DNA repair protein RadA [Synechococcus sp. PCC 7336]|uniref:DNA repair protein RadA n=1 Tax=Synechococcus sp. PCC 7336 TaxID=195250 RepID=UPI0003476B0D|nr:DNA repair protein RadA [Synechococcus sp. PCC 7336]